MSDDLLREVRIHAHHTPFCSKIHGDADECDCGVDHFLARIDAHLASGGWIPVTERLPSEYESVLVGRSDVIDPIIAHWTGKIWTFDVMKGAINITHWQPLPPLPKG